jgi:hypothetical protein
LHITAQSLHNVGDEIHNGVMARCGGRGAVELAERTPSVLVVVDCFPANI